MSASIAALVLTRNEENDLAACLETLAWCDIVYVCDSFSTDQTIEIARRSGAQIFQRVFDGYASQRNAALAELPAALEWVLVLDADERVPAALASEIKAAVDDVSETVAGFQIRRRDFFAGRWLRHVQITSCYVRLFRPGKARYHREINEVIEIDGAVAALREPFDHFPFSKGLERWIARHNEYSTAEARQALAEHGLRFSWRAALTSPDLRTRRRHQKGLFYRLPGRPILKFVYLLIWRRAFLDGAPGITYAILQSIYEWFIVIKQRELQRREQMAAGE